MTRLGGDAAAPERGGLVLKLRPNEKMLVNGVVLQNGRRPARLCVKTAGVSILRLRDALHPDEAKTPARRLYYIAQLALAEEADPRVAAVEILEGLKALAFLYPDRRALIEATESAARQGKFFVAMRALRRLFPADDALTAPNENPT
jgi:flagellar protein FlbT